MGKKSADNLVKAITAILKTRGLDRVLLVLAFTLSVLKRPVQLLML